MRAWQVVLEGILSAPDAPAVLDRKFLQRIGRRARGNEPVPPRTLNHWTRSAVERKRLIHVLRGLYLNAFRSAAGQPADAAHYLRRDAIVSLNTALGDAGVLNNPSATITAVVPFYSGVAMPRLGRQKTAVGWFHFFGMPGHIVEAGDPDDRIDPGFHDHVRATPERALVDWLYLAASPYSQRAAPVPGDLDLGLLDQRRLRRLTAAVGVDIPVAV